MDINLVIGTLIKVQFVLVTGTAHWRTTEDARLIYLDASSHIHYVELKITRGTVDDVRMKGKVKSHSVNYHKFADDLQIYASYIYCPHVPGDLECAVQRLSDCIGEVKCWLVKHKLKLNESKTGFMVALSRHNLQKYGLPGRLRLSYVRELLA